MVALVGVCIKVSELTDQLVSVQQNTRTAFDEKMEKEVTRLRYSTLHCVAYPPATPQEYSVESVPCGVTYSANENMTGIEIVYMRLL